jgi:hypothetical protein
MSKTHTHHQTIEMLGPIDSMDLTVEVVFTKSRDYPATWDEPAHGGEIGITEIHLFDTATKKYLDVAPWLQTFLRKAIDEGALFEYAREETFA